MNKKERHRANYIPFRCSDDTAKIIADVARERGIPKAEVLRQFVDAGMKMTGGRLDEGYLYELVTRAVAEQLDPKVERLAAISAKATQIGSAAFFLAIWAATKDGSEEERAAIEDAAESARKLGIQYLKLKDKDLDAFIKNGAKQILEE